jgi:hypothetical protein
MSTLRTDFIQTSQQAAAIPLTELQQRVIKTYRNTYRGGSWEASDTYQWLVAGFHDYTPASAASRIRFSLNLSYAHTDGHAIAHCIFFANGVERGRHSIAGQSPEHRHLYIWDVASWGTTLGRIGYQVRRYGGSNRPRFHGTHHWDGVGSNQNAQSEIVIEEYLPIS